MRGLLDDARFALRGFAKTPAFTVTAVVTLALGIGAVTVVYALANAFLLRPLPAERPEELVAVSMVHENTMRTPSVDHAQFEVLREQRRGMQSLAAWALNDYGVAVDGDPEATVAMDVSGNYFDVLGLRPALGRFFAPEEDAVPGAHPVAIVSHNFWQTRLGGTPDAVGRRILVSGQPLTVIGVAPAGFTGTIIGIATGVWIPIAMHTTISPGRDVFTPGRQYWLNVIGRRAPGTTLEQAQALLTGAIAALDEDTRTTRFDPRAGMAGRSPVTAVRLEPLRAVPADGRGALIGFMSLLLITAGLVFAIGCVNVASMLLARATTRGREIGVRLSLGASRGRIVRQLLTESTLLFLLGGAAAVLLATWGAGLLAAIRLPLPVPIEIDVSVDRSVMLVAFVTALLAGTLFGLAPALHGLRDGIAIGIRDSAGTPRGTRLRGAFVVGQVALSVVLLISAGLLVRALQGALTADQGMDTHGVVIAQIELSPLGYEESAATDFFDRLRERLTARAGVESTALSVMVNLTGSEYRTGMQPEGEVEPVVGGVFFNVVDPGYFDLLRVPVVAGRGFTAADHAGAQRVAVVNQAFAERYWPGRSPIGRQLLGSGEPIEVVGVVPTGRYHSLAEEPRPLVYLPHAQRYYSGMFLYVRGTAPASALLAAVREETSALDPNVTLRWNMTLAEATGIVLFPQRFAASIIGLFGVLGLVLSAVGVYGLVAFSVGQRRREIGVRIALGASARDVIAFISAQGARLIALGCIIGLAIAFAASRLLRALLLGTSPTDPLTFLGVPLLLAAVGALAAWLPARRASDVDPMHVLREE